MTLTLAPVNALNQIFTDAYDVLKNGLKVSRDKLFSLTEAGIKDYYEKRLPRYERLHTLLSPHAPVKIEDIFVNPTLEHSGGYISAKDIYKFIEDRKIIVIKGMAGQGKSILLKNIFCTLTNSGNGLIPVFLELRDLDFDNESVDGAAYREIFSGISEYPKGAFQNLLNAGRFLFLLDGLDELNPKYRSTFLKKIDKFTKDFPRCCVVITTRPTDVLDSWGVSTHCEINDYGKEEVEDLVRRSPIEQAVKDRFIENLNKFYYETHSRFLSNPLLCNMMILTFMQGGDIPKQKHIFYKKAFDTLHLHHDNMKFLYKREYHSGLAEDLFVRIWRSFCYFSYVDYITKFTKNSIRLYIERSCEYNNIDADSENILCDFVESLCVIVRDGDNYVFLHRSFQEYAVAEFLVTEQIDNLVDVCDLLICRSEDDSLNLAFSINQGLIENKYIVEKIDEIIKFLASTKSINRKLDAFFDELSADEVDGDGEYKLLFSMDTDNGRRFGYFLFFVRGKYNLQYDSEIIEDVKNYLLSKGGKSNDTSYNFAMEPETQTRNSPFRRFSQEHLAFLKEAKKIILSRQKNRRAFLALR